MTSTCTPRGELSLSDDGDTGVHVEPPCKWIKDLHIAAPRRTVEARWTNNDNGLAVVIIGEAIAPIRGLCPAVSGARMIPILIARQTGQSATFHTVLMPFKKVVDLSATTLPNALEIRHGTIVDHLSLSPNAAPALTRNPKPAIPNPIP